MAILSFTVADWDDYWVYEHNLGKISLGQMSPIYPGFFTGDENGTYFVPDVNQIFTRSGKTIASFQQELVNVFNMFFGVVGVNQDYVMERARQYVASHQPISTTSVADTSMVYLSVASYPITGGYVNVSGSDQKAVGFQVGESVTLEAIPFTGYHFISWTQNEVVVSTKKKINYSPSVGGDYSMVANFSTAAATETQAVVASKNTKIALAGIGFLGVGAVLAKMLGKRGR